MLIDMFHTSVQIAKTFRISYPLKDFSILQGFGENKVSFYSELGYKGHNGLDIRALTGTPVYAVCNGETIAYADSTGGIGVEIFSDPFELDGQKTRLRFINYHLLRFLIASGSKVSKGQIIALSDNTGKYTTGAHLHFGVKEQVWNGTAWTQDMFNGYGGAIDPKPLFDDNVDLLPVDRRYGKTFNWLVEFITRFKTPAIHQALIKQGRTPLGLQNRELNALVYGGWTIDEVLTPSLWTVWTTHEKSFIG